MPHRRHPVAPDGDGDAVDDSSWNDEPEQPHDIHTTNPNETTQLPWTLSLSFWLLGLLNNSSYVIMIASAKTISEGGTALVFLANVLPSFLIKLSAPYWFDKISYSTRMAVASIFMVASFAWVATLLTTTTTAGELVEDSASTSSWKSLAPLWGVALGSAQCGLGEASLLAAAGHMGGSSGKAVGWFSSGTGLAGVVGFAWKFVFHDVLLFDMATTLWMAISLAVAYAVIFWKGLAPYLTSHEDRIPQEDGHGNDERQPLELKPIVTMRQESTGLTSLEEDDDDALAHDTITRYHDDPEQDPHESHERSSHHQIYNDDITPPQPVQDMTVWQRATLVLTLWPYIIPLFVVYAAEYSLQAGTWTAIGFPVNNPQARDAFYEYRNWMYQAGVFVSRSSGTLGTASMWLLWVMPMLQALNVVSFAHVATAHVWYSYAWLLPGCFYVGLLGGAVYVHGYKRICADFHATDRREFALAATSVAESFGIVCADVVGLFIQSCLYQVNHIAGAMVECPIPTRLLLLRNGYQ